MEGEEQRESAALVHAEHGSGEGPGATHHPPLALPAGLKPNVQQRFDRLEAVWNQARLGIRDGGAPQREDDFEVVREPSRPPRTPPTPEEVDAIRTAKASGESVRSIAERFDKHRSTVWRYTKDIR
uniref:helix-turn-helix domain-containing protein n=1 Tax=Tessaracoccus bendigoensis TaxID=72764 RepID=UPI003CCC45DA